MLWDAGEATSLTFNGSARRLARTDDVTANGGVGVSITSNAPSAGLTTVTFTYTPPGGGAPQAVGLVVTGAASLVPGPSSFTLSGTITGSSMIHG